MEFIRTIPGIARDTYTGFSRENFNNAYRKISPVLGKFFQDMKSKVSSSARTIGISVRQTLEEFLDSFVPILDSFVDNSIRYFASAIINFIRSSLGFLEGALKKIYDTLSFKNWRETIVSYLCLLMLLLAISIPSTSISTTGRVCIAILSAVIFYTKSFMKASVAAFFLAILAKFTPKNSITINNKINAELQYDPKEVRDDAKTLIMNVVSTGILFSAATTGLDFPTDAKSWDNLLRRHALLHKSFQAWDFGSEKIVELFESSSRIVCKYVFGTEYTSLTHIQEVENLILEVMDLSTLEKQFLIGKDEELSLKIELLYTQYLQLCKIYCNNSLIKKKLDVISGPLLAYYRRVSNKNPRANAMRKEPVVIALKGGTGLGKTYLATAFQQDLLKICGKYRADECLSGQIYARNIEQEFWDGYVGQPIVVFDDFGQHVDSVNNPNEEFFEVIRAANIFPYMLHSAELAEKANNPFRADFIYLTTNDRAFEPKSLISKEAFQRRIHIDMEMHIIKEVQDQQGLLDQAKLQIYRSDKNLDESDFSHVFFCDHKNDFKKYSYEELIVKIGAQYEKHVNNFEGRKRMAFLKRDQKLPQGCYTADKKWSLQAETYRLSTACFFNQPLFLQKQILQQGFTVVNSHNLVLSTKDNIEDLKTAILNSAYYSEILKLDKAPVVEPRLLSSIVFGRPPLQDTNYLLRLRQGAFPASSIPDYPDITEDMLDLIEEAFENESQSSETGWNCPEWRADYRSQVGFKTYYLHLTAHYFGMFGLKCIQILSSLRDNYPRFFFYAKWFSLGMAGLSLVSAFKDLYSSKGIYGSDLFLEAPVLSFYNTFLAGRNIQAIVQLIDVLSPLNPTIMSFTKISCQTLRVLSVCSLLKKFFNHAILHKVFDKSCSVCKEYESLRNVSSDANGLSCSELLSANLENLDVIIDQCKTSESQYKPESPNKSLNRNISKFESQEQALQHFKGKLQKFVKYNEFITSSERSDQEIIDYLISLDLLAPSQIPSLSNTVLESPNRTQNSKIISKFENDDQMPLLPNSGVINPQIKKMFFRTESGRSLSEDRKKKLSNLEGLLSPQCDVLAQKAMGSFWKISVIADSEVRDIGNIFCIKGRHCLINIHFVEIISNFYDQTQGNIKLAFRQHGKTESLETDLRCILGAQPVFRGTNQTEFMLFELPREFPMAPDFTKHLITPSDVNKLGYGVRLLLAKPEESPGNLSFKTKEGPYLGVTTIVVQDLVDTDKVHTYVGSAQYDISTNNGDCGSPIFINSNMFQRKLLGFHYCGKDGGGSCSIITYDDLKSISNSLCAADPELAKLEADRNLLPNLSCKVNGYVSQPVTHPCSTNLCKSAIFECLGPSEMAPAILKPAFYPDGPMINGFKKYSLKRTIRLDPVIREKVIRSYFEENIANKMAYEYEIKRLSYEEACAGIEGNQYIAPLKRSKSAGYPYMLYAKKGKEDWFGSDAWNFDNDNFKSLKKDCAKIENQIEHGIVPEVIFVATLKDEKRTLDKVAKQSTRVFSASPLHFTIVFRRYFSGFFAFIMRNKINNNCAVGTNVHSSDWTDIYRHLQFSGLDPEVLAGDFSNFDGDLLIDIMDDILTIINQFYSDRFAHRRKALWQCITNSKQLIFDTVLELFNGQPSGNPGTAIINSIYVDLIFRHVHYNLGPFVNKFSFKDVFKIITYGDDHVLSVSPAISKLIDPIDISNLMTEFGHGYTDSYKNPIEENTPWSKIQDVSFLKRKFAFDHHYNYVFAPLEMRSIREMINWIQKDAAPLAALKLNCEGAFRELIHHEQATFNVKTYLIQSALRNVNCAILIPNYELMRWQMVRGELKDMFANAPWV
ncbi:hypothetical protein [Panonychus citri cripavirus]|nr:hypothetical protein [Panonychus citri cripavirus]